VYRSTLWLKDDEDAPSVLVLETDSEPELLMTEGFFKIMSNPYDGNGRLIGAPEERVLAFEVRLVEETVR
jgi:hypothetical protein